MGAVEEAGSVVLEYDGRGNGTKDLSTPMVPPVLAVGSKPQGRSASRCAQRCPFSEARRKGRAWSTAQLPSGPVFCSSFWTQPCLPYKLRVNCGPSSCGCGPRDTVFLSDEHVACCHKKVQHMDLLRNMHQVYFLTSK